jgi:hypothetical protein
MIRNLVWFSLVGGVAVVNTACAPTPPTVIVPARPGVVITRPVIVQPRVTNRTTVIRQAPPVQRVQQAPPVRR